MKTGDMIELGNNTVKIEKEYDWTSMNLFELGKFINCTVEVFDQGIVVIQDKDENCGSCGLFIVDTRINKLYEAVLEMPHFEHYDKVPIE